MPHQQVRHPRVTQPSALRTRRYAFDLNVLGTPPAFTLSQDQTLHHECTSSLSLFETLPSREFKPQKESSALLSQRPLAISYEPLACTCGGLVHTSRFFLLFLWHVCIHRKTFASKLPRKQCLCSTLLLFRYSGAVISRA